MAVLYEGKTPSIPLWSITPQRTMRILSQGTRSSVNIGRCCMSKSWDNIMICLRSCEDSMWQVWCIYSYFPRPITVQKRRQATYGLIRRTGCSPLAKCGVGQLSTPTRSFGRWWVGRNFWDRLEIPRHIHYRWACLFVSKTYGYTQQERSRGVDQRICTTRSSTL